jgi:glutathione S-transferase
MALVLYSNPMSRGRIARWMLEEVGAPYEVRYLRYGPEMRSPEFLAINPMGKMPTLVHDGAVVTECAAVCAYLADAFPQAGLAPPTTARADYYRWMFFAAGPLEAATTNKSMGWSAPAEREAMLGYGDFERTTSSLAKRLAQSPYVCGDTFTAADVYVGSHIGWGLGFKSLPALPEFVAYWERLAPRPAQLRAKALDDAAAAEFGPKPAAG